MRLEHTLHFKYNSQINTSKLGPRSGHKSGSALEKKLCGIAYEATEVTNVQNNHSEKCEYN